MAVSAVVHLYILKYIHDEVSASSIPGDLLLTPLWKLQQKATEAQTFLERFILPVGIKVVGLPPIRSSEPRHFKSHCQIFFHSTAIKAFLGGFE